MQRITWYLLLAVGVLVAPIAGRAQAPKAQAPQAKVREIATIPDVDVGAAERMPNGRAPDSVRSSQTRLLGSQTRLVQWTSSGF